MQLAVALGWNLSAVTPWKFIERFLKAANANAKERAFTWYLAELMLQEWCFVGVKSSLIAAAIINLARQTTCTAGQEIWTKTLRYYTRYSPRELEACVRNLHRVRFQCSDLMVVGNACTQSSNCSRR